jgi:hypothetical protein
MAGIRQNTPPELQALRARVERLLLAGLQPIEVVMAPETWENLQRQHASACPAGRASTASAREVLGFRSRLVPGAQGCVIRYFGAIDLPPDEAVSEGFIDLDSLRVGRRSTRDRD